MTSDTSEKDTPLPADAPATSQENPPPTPEIPKSDPEAETPPEPKTDPSIASPQATEELPKDDPPRRPESKPQPDQPDQSKPPLRKRVVTLLKVTLIVFTCVGFILAALFLDLRQYATTPMAPSNNDTRRFEVPQGYGLQRISRSLFQAELIRVPWKFRLIGRWYGYDRNIKHGEYRLSSRMSPLEIYQQLISGRVVLYKITIPEGYSYRQIAQAVAAKGFDTPEAVEAAATDPHLIRQYGLETDSLEGYLFPDTYHFPRNANAVSIVKAMLLRFQQVATAQWRADCKTLGMSVHEAVTLASIIEKETAAPSERAVIASVFHNRLQKGMRLETDPTVIYGIPNFNGNLTRKDLRTPTPYNTYVIKGLPPGPISNPGAEALIAAVHPAKTDYLFFVSKKNGTHQFSATLKEHNRAVYRYQLNRRRN